MVPPLQAMERCLSERQVASGACHPPRPGVGSRCVACSCLGGPARNQWPRASQLSSPPPQPFLLTPADRPLQLRCSVRACVVLSTRGSESCAGHPDGGTCVRSNLHACPAAGPHYQTAPCAADGPVEANDAGGDWIRNPSKEKKYGLSIYLYISNQNDSRCTN